ncbi:hypothetical protein [Micromonospora halophytica]|uniref:Uncharacterized protein n=1 Tax=Micromonospora halophytica TaxID=47864 RepID=A0A1C5HBM3_9ACTN|nr:hypothetical protein [Micromonospora halophytica]SCG43380.1 hypothetical protein GA0070560_103434 [Micromonospora halophytica]
MATQLTTHPAARAVDRYRPLGVALTALAAAMATASLLGPLGFDLMRYRTSPTTLHQLLVLFVMAPLAVAAAVLAYRRHPVAPPLATGVAGYAVYTYAQVIIGQEYLRLPGTVERFFPLLLAVFLLAEAVLVLAWRALPSSLPAPSARLRRATGTTLLVAAGFLTFGLHLPTMLTAWSDPTAMTEYASSPTPFWMVKLMDLGIVVPAAVAVGVGVLRRAGWAQRVAYPLLTWLTCLAVSVTSMAVVMLADGDPDASPVLAVGFGVVTVALAWLTVAAHRPLAVRRVPAASALCYCAPDIPRDLVTLSAGRGAPRPAAGVRR